METYSFGRGSGFDIWRPIFCGYGVIIWNKVVLEVGYNRADDDRTNGLFFGVKLGTFPCGFKISLIILRREYYFEISI